MANPLRQNRTHAAELAALSLAGIRPLVQDTVTVTAGAEDTYTVQDKRTNRVILFHSSGNNTDIRFELGASATAAKMPMASDVYFSVQAVVDEVIHLWNTTGGDITVNVMEIT